MSILAKQNWIRRRLEHYTVISTCSILQIRIVKEFGYQLQGTIGITYITYLILSMSHHKTSISIMYETYMVLSTYVHSFILDYIFSMYTKYRHADLHALLLNGYLFYVPKEKSFSLSMFICLWHGTILC